MNITEATNSIPKTKKRVWTHFEWGNTNAIIKTILKVSDKEVVLQQTKEFSKYFKASTPQAQIEKLRELWAWVRDNIKYIPDPKGIQKIKHPARTYEDRYADCKSMSIFIHSVLYNLNIPHYYVFTSYTRKKRIQHVYTILEIDGKKIPIDTVYHQFGAEEPYTHLVEKRSKSMTQIVEIAGTKKQHKQSSNIILPKKLHIPYAAMTEGEVMLALNVRQYDLIQAINKGNGFHQEAGEAARFRDTMQNVLDRGLHQSTSDKYAGSPQFKQLIKEVERRDFFSMEGHIRHTVAASVAGPFDPSSVQIEDCRNMAREQAIYEQDVLNNPTRLGLLIAEFMQPCLDIKQMENVVNAHMEDAGVIFLYELMGQDHTHYNAAIQVKTLHQLNWIQETSRVTGLSESVIRSICANGVVASVEDTPLELYEKLGAAMRPNGSRIGEPMTAAAIVTLIVKIVGAVTAAVTAATLFVNAVKPISKHEKAYDDIVDPDSPLLLPIREDFPGDEDITSSGNGGGNSGGSTGANGMSNFLTPQNILLGAAAAYYFTK